jgi:cupin 2 domain-containing protein
MSHGNLTAGIPAELTEELASVLAAGQGIRIERIVSQGQVSPEGFWYDQEDNEFVLVVSGGARLELEGRGEVSLAAGDWVDIPAHRRHRVSWTDPARQTVWLAVFYR